MIDAYTSATREMLNLRRGEALTKSVEEGSVLHELYDLASRRQEVARVGLKAIYDVWVGPESASPPHLVDLAA